MLENQGTVMDNEKHEAASLLAVIADAVKLEMARLTGCIAGCDQLIEQRVVAEGEESEMARLADNIAEDEQLMK